MKTSLVNQGGKHSRSTMRALAGQQGVVLLFALMALIAMSMAGIAFMRSVDSAGIMGGNLAFNRASISISDLGLEAARTRMFGLEPATGCANTKNCVGWVSNPATSTCATGPAPAPNSSRWYWANWQAFGDNYREYDWSNACYVDPGNDLGGFRVHYIVHRMCANDGDPIGNNCVSASVVDEGGKDLGSQDVTTFRTNVAATAQPYFRVTIRVVGPRNVEAYVVSWML